MSFVSPLGHPDITLEQTLLGSQQVLNRIRLLIGSVGPQARAAQFYTRVRAKTLESVEEKIRLRRSQPDSRDYSFRNVTDFVGLRIITLYDDQLVQALDHVLGIVEAGQTSDEPVFRRGNKWDCFHDAKFSARTGEKFDVGKSEGEQTDIYYKCYAHLLHQVAPPGERGSSADWEKVYPNSEALERKTDDNKSWYSSAHLTFWATAYLGSGFVLQIPVEFQIRTAVEDVWAEINHKLLYKSGSRFIWSRAYQASRSGAKRISGDLKKKIETLPEQVEAFRAASRTAQLIAQDFWGDKKISPSHSRRAANKPTSLCAALVYMVQDGDTTGRISACLEKYNAAMAQIADTGQSPVQIAKTLQRQIALLDNLEQELSDDATKPDLPEEAKLCCIQQSLLLQIEMLRLEAHMVLKTGHILSADRSGVDPFRPDALAREALRLYIRLCGFVETAALRIRPMTMLYTWKFMLAEAFDRNLAKENILIALSLLKSDPSLPDWSVYKVVVPSSVATVLSDEATSLHDNIVANGGNLDLMMNLAASVKEKLRDAVRFAIQAFDEHNDMDRAKVERRGDIGYLRSSYTPLKEAETIMSIAFEFDRRFKAFIGHNSHFLTQKINEALAYIQEHLDKFYKNDRGSDLFLADDETKARIFKSIEHWVAVCQV